jgi:hypothetical protein
MVLDKDHLGGGRCIFEHYMQAPAQEGNRARGPEHRDDRRHAEYQHVLMPC